MFSLSYHNHLLRISSAISFFLRLLNSIEDVLITINQGILKGSLEKTYKGDLYYSFKGIPYAKPPIGGLRFEAPQSPESWKGILDASQHRNKSVQAKFFSYGEILGSEDCLYLNLYSKKDPKKELEKLQPVMVWIHGGAFRTGSGDCESAGPDYLISEDILLVTINYRLGIFGFLKANDQDLNIPGNNGLRDQIMALKWIKNNIKTFGGDPDNVTIFGESAGGMSVHILTLSPLATGLFHKAIVQSSSVLARWAYTTSVMNPLRELVKHLNIQDNTQESKIIKHLLKAPYQKLVKAQNQIEFYHGGPSYFGPTIEKESKHQPVLSDDPLRIIRSGKINQVPLIIGYTSREGMLCAEAIGTFFKDVEDYVPFFLRLEKGSEKSMEIAQKISHFYFGGEKPTGDNVDISYLVLSDTLFQYPIHEVIKEIIRVSSENVYLYRFSFEDTRATGLKALLKIKLPGVCHAGELPFLFKSNKLPTSKIIANGAQDLTIRRLAKLWTNFAKYGNPNPKELSDLITIKWEIVNKGLNNDFDYLQIGRDLSIGKNPDWNRYKFWQNITK